VATFAACGNMTPHVATDFCGLKHVRPHTQRESRIFAVAVCSAVQVCCANCGRTCAVFSVGRAGRGAGSDAERPVKCRRGGGREKVARRSTKEKALVVLGTPEVEAMTFSQFVEPRCARSASGPSGRAGPSPRSNGAMGQAVAARSFSALGRRRKVRPNPSLERTRNGMPPPRGRRYAVHSLRPRGGGMPLRSAQLKR
jgi:hypothetical protein